VLRGQGYRAGVSLQRNGASSYLSGRREGDVGGRRRGSPRLRCGRFPILCTLSGPPAQVMVIPVTDAPAEPVLVRSGRPCGSRTQVNVLVAPPDRKLAARSAFPVTATCAAFSLSPKTPKTKPLQRPRRSG